jgi:16S rRNA (uracil1498-N3)-methyltransferase
LRRFFIEEIKERDGFLTIVGSEAKHITRVLRMGRGDRLILMDGKGARFKAVIESAGHKEVLVTLEKPIPRPPSSPAKIILCQAILKSRAMDYVVQKTSELGVHCILPFSSERTVVNLEKDKFENKMRHWGEIAQNAAKQSDREIPADIGPLLSLKDLMERWKQKDAIKVIMWEEEGAKDLKTILRKSPPMREFIGIVGPEGGFTREEIQMAKEAGFTSTSMGYRVLRSETAAITMVAIVQYEWGDLTLDNL